MWWWDIEEIIGDDKFLYDDCEKKNLDKKEYMTGSWVDERGNKEMCKYF